LTTPLKGGRFIYKQKTIAKIFLLFNTRHASSETRRCYDVTWFNHLIPCQQQNEYCPLKCKQITFLISETDERDFEKARTCLLALLLF
jgi:hypothetical protein